MPSVIYRSVCNIERIEEIRLRCGKHICAFNGSKNIICEARLDHSDFIKTLSVLCNGTLYAHMNTINEGYISVKNGIRVGVVGRANVKNGIIESLTEITSLCIRVPGEYTSVSYGIYERLKLNGFRDSVLLFSPPGIGKTTVIRDISMKLASYPSNKRVCIVDTRKEIECESMDIYDNIDILSGYPKPLGISIATRTMNPEYIICDEVGGYDECHALLTAQNSGVPVIASAHGGDISSILMRENIKLLHNSRLFSLYIKIERDISAVGKNIYTYYTRNEL